jgi:hypothetical protein
LIRLHLKPINETISSVDVHWQAPERGTEIKGVLYVFHGCNHDGEDWFYLPEDMIVTYTALQAGLAVVAISSEDREVLPLYISNDCLFLSHDVSN